MESQGYEYQMYGAILVFCTILAIVKTLEFPFLVAGLEQYCAILNQWEGAQDLVVYSVLGSN